MTTFVFKLKAPRPTFALDMTAEEQEIMGRHAAYWQPWMDSGQMEASAPYSTTRARGGSVSAKPRMRKTCGHTPRTIPWSQREPPTSESASCSPGSRARLDAEVTQRVGCPRPEW